MLWCSYVTVIPRVTLLVCFCSANVLSFPSACTGALSHSGCALDPSRSTVGLLTLAAALCHQLWSPCLAPVWPTPRTGRRWVVRSQLCGCCMPRRMQKLRLGRLRGTVSGTGTDGVLCLRLRRLLVHTVLTAWMTRTGDSWESRCGRRGLPHAGGARRRRHCLTKSFQGLVI